MNNSDKEGEKDMVPEIPKVLEKANVVRNLEHLLFAGDLPVGISYIHLLTGRLRKMNAKGKTCRGQRRSNGEK